MLESNKEAPGIDQFQKAVHAGKMLKNRVFISNRISNINLLSNLNFVPDLEALIMFRQMRGEIRV